MVVHLLEIILRFIGPHNLTDLAHIQVQPQLCYNLIEAFMVNLLFIIPIVVLTLDPELEYTEHTLLAKLV